jgi:hypothetical protein
MTFREARVCFDTPKHAQSRSPNVPEGTRDALRVVAASKGQNQPRFFDRQS